MVGGGGVGMVKRYDFNGYDFSKDEEVDGDYVSYEDYEKLQKENERIKQEKAEVIERLRETVELYEEVENDYDR